ncbi:hypothetical protein ACWEQA_08910 [Nocardia sp. NPDC004085]
MAGLAGLFVPKNRPAGPVPVQASAEVLIAVGRRLAGPGVTNRAPRDIAGAWKSIFGPLLNQADESTLTRIVAEIPAMASPYAVNIIHRPPEVGSSEVARELDAIRAAPLAAEVQRAIDFYAKRGGFPIGGWPELDVDLREAEK